MKSLLDYLKESVNVEEQITEQENVNEGKIESEEDFREYAENKFEEVFGEELDEEKMKKTIDGLLEDNKDLVEKGDWGELVGILNKSFNESVEEPIESEPIEESCKDLNKMTEDELWDELGYLYKIKDEKEHKERFDAIKSKILELKK